MALGQVKLIAVVCILFYEVGTLLFLGHLQYSAPVVGSQVSQDTNF